MDGTAGPTSADLDFSVHGAQLVRSVVSAALPDLRSILGQFASDRAGTRIGRDERLRPYLVPSGLIGSLAAGILGPQTRAVRAILFDKTAEMNWSLAWHQDRTICVKQRVEVEGFGPWTIKGGMQHVAPPFELLAHMVTLRVHLDDVPATNAPLLIVPGSHAIGRIPVESIDCAVRRLGTRPCLATAGDVWLYSTPIVHASEVASCPARRRVLQVDFAARELPGGLEWLGV